MATIQPLRGEPPTAETVANDRLPAASALQSWLDGRPENDRLVDLLAFALATERGLTPNTEAMGRMRDQATAALAAYSIRNLHNRVAEIRQEAVLEHLGHFARPPGFFKLVFAALVAVVLAGGAACALYLHPETLAALAGLIPG